MYKAQKSSILWTVLVGVFTLSVLGVVFLHLGDAVRALCAIPAVVAICTAMFTVLREDIAHERAVLLQDAKNHFELGVTSHMADVAFDKHVLFCEEYSKELYSALATLFREGPSRKVLVHVYKLGEIRRNWAVWVTPQAGQELDKFETAMNEIGAHAQYLESVPGDSASIKIMFSKFAEVYGLAAWNGEPVSKKLAITTAVGRLREVLGTDQLTRLRTTFIRRANDKLHD